VSGFLCIDASVAAKWVLPEEGSELALDLYARSRDDDTTLIAPPHLPIEVTNAIRRRVARKLITSPEGEALLDAFLDFALSLAAPLGLYERALQLAERFDRPTAYDTHYVALAEIAGCELLTADRTLINALGGQLSFVKPLGYHRPA